MPSADLFAVHCDVPVRVTSLGASQAAERKPQAALQGDAHEGRVNATKRVSSCFADSTAMICYSSGLPKADAIRAHQARYRNGGGGAPGCARGGKGSYARSCRERHRHAHRKVGTPPDAR
eukprot:6175212-Pleurochrysis_carterae.AAC.1